MSRLKELIAKLCPNGVEYKSIGSMINRVRTKGKSDKSVTQVYVVSNTLGIVRSEDYHENEIHSEDTSNYTIIRSGMFVYNPSRLNIGSIGMLTYDEPGLVSPMYTVFSVKDNKVITKEYLMYNLKSSYVKNRIDSLKEEGARFRFDFERWDKIIIPVPPIEVQEEIVRILDTFTELQAELQAELTARKKQYEYYRERLILRNIEKTLPLSEVCDIKGRIGFRGYTKNDIVPEGKGAISFSPGNIVDESIILKSNTYVSWEKYEESPEIMVEEGDILLCKTGSTLGKVDIVEELTEKATINPQLVVLKNIRCNRRFPKYVIGGYEFQTEMKRKKGLGSVPNISQKDLGSILVKLPPLEEQKMIADILDKLHALCSSISNGIPAEIAARQKQYEYYRDKLLTFKELS